MKEQKQLQEDISRMSSKAMLKVQDDIKSLRQLLSVSGSGLQRSALAIDKLKVETAQVRTCTRTNAHTHATSAVRAQSDVSVTLSRPTPRS